MTDTNPGLNSLLPPCPNDQPSLLNNSVLCQPNAQTNVTFSVETTERPCNCQTADTGLSNAVVQCTVHCVSLTQGSTAHSTDELTMEDRTDSNDDHNFEDDQENFENNQEDDQENFEDDQENFEDDQENFEDDQVNFEDDQVNFEDDQVNFEDNRVNFEEERVNKLIGTNDSTTDQETIPGDSTTTTDAGGYHDNNSKSFLDDDGGGRVTYTHLQEEQILVSSARVGGAHSYENWSIILSFNKEGGGDELAGGCGKRKRLNHARLKGSRAPALRPRPPQPLPRPGHTKVKMPRPPAPLPRKRRTSVKARPQLPGSSVSVRSEGDMAQADEMGGDEGEEPSDDGFVEGNDVSGSRRRRKRQQGITPILSTAVSPPSSPSNTPTRRRTTPSRKSRSKPRQRKPSKPVPASADISTQETTTPGPASSETDDSELGLLEEAESITNSNTTPIHKLVVEEEEEEEGEMSARVVHKVTPSTTSLSKATPTQNRTTHQPSNGLNEKKRPSAMSKRPTVGGARVGDRAPRESNNESQTSDAEMTSTSALSLSGGHKGGMVVGVGRKIDSDISTAPFSSETSDMSGNERPAKKISPPSGIPRLSPVLSRKTTSNGATPPSKPSATPSSKPGATPTQRGPVRPRAGNFVSSKRSSVSAMISQFDVSNRSSSPVQAQDTPSSPKPAGERPKPHPPIKPMLSAKPSLKPKPSVTSPKQTTPPQVLSPNETTPTEVTSLKPTVTSNKETIDGGTIKTENSLKPKPVAGTKASPPARPPPPKMATAVSDTSEESSSSSPKPPAPTGNGTRGAGGGANRLSMSGANKPANSTTGGNGSAKLVGGAKGELRSVGKTSSETKLVGGANEQVLPSKGLKRSPTAPPTNRPVVSKATPTTGRSSPDRPTKLPTVKRTASPVVTVTSKATPTASTPSVKPTTVKRNVTRTTPSIGDATPTSSDKPLNIKGGKTTPTLPKKATPSTEGTSPVVLRKVTSSTGNASPTVTKKATPSTDERRLSFTPKKATPTVENTTPKTRQEEPEKIETTKIIKKATSTVEKATPTVDKATPTNNSVTPVTNVSKKVTTPTLQMKPGIEQQQQQSSQGGGGAIIDTANNRGIRRASPRRPPPDPPMTTPPTSPTAPPPVKAKSPTPDGRASPKKRKPHPQNYEEFVPTLLRSGSVSSQPSSPPPPVPRSATPPSCHYEGVEDILPRIAAAKRISQKTTPTVDDETPPPLPPRNYFPEDPVVTLPTALTTVEERDGPDTPTMGHRMMSSKSKSVEDAPPPLPSQPIPKRKNTFTHLPSPPSCSPLLKRKEIPASLIKASPPLPIKSGGGNKINVYEEISFGPPPTQYRPRSNSSGSGTISSPLLPRAVHQHYEVAEGFRGNKQNLLPSYVKLSPAGSEEDFPNQRRFSASICVTNSLGVSAVSIRRANSDRQTQRIPLTVAASSENIQHGGRSSLQRTSSMDILDDRMNTRTSLTDPGYSSGEEENFTLSPRNVGLPQPPRSFTIPVKRSSPTKLDSDEEPLYQHINHVDFTSTPVSFPTDKSQTVPAKSSNQLEIARQLSFNHRKLWCEQPTVIQSGVLGMISDQDRKLQEAMFEVLTSEESYLRSLNVLIEHFMDDPGMNPNLPEGRRVLDKRQHHVIFSNVREVQAISSQFLKELQQRQRESAISRNICDIILKYAENEFSCYIPYCTNQVYQMRELTDLLENNVMFQDYLKRLEAHRRCQNLSMTSFLLLPMQRITRLPLLVLAILNRTPMDNPNHQLVEKALRTVQKLVTACNDGARQMERTEELHLIHKQLEFGKMKPFPLVSVSRQLERKGSLVLLQVEQRLFGKPRIRRIPIYLFAFTDYVLITKKKNNPKGGDVVSYRVMDYASKAVVETVDKLKVLSNPVFPKHVFGEQETVAKATWAVSIAEEHNSFLLIFLENSSQKSEKYIIVAQNETDRTRWLEALSHPAKEKQKEDEKIYESWDCPQVQAIYDYEAQQHDELGLMRGDIVKVYRKMADGWYEGERLRDLQWGWFPSNFTVEVENAHTRARNLRERHRLLSLPCNPNDFLQNFNASN